MKKTPIGHMSCPVCLFADAEVKEDKNDHAYMHCTDCNAQLFTRNDYRNGHLRKRMRPVTVTGTDPAPANEPAPPATPPAVPPPPAAPPAAPPAPAPKAAKRPWFQPLMAGGGNG